MPCFPDWLAGVLDRGESVQAAPPTVSAADRDVVREMLERAYRDHARDVAGPPLPFDAETAVAAALVLAEACWRVASGETKNAPPDRLGVPGSAAAHLSADVTLRFLPAVWRRAKARGPDDPTAEWVGTVLRRWPLSGVLADLDAAPLVVPDFDGHPGLCLVFAERLAERPRAAWLPPDGPARDAVERVFDRLNRPLPRPTPAAPEPP